MAGRGGRCNMRAWMRRGKIRGCWTINKIYFSRLFLCNFLILLLLGLCCLAGLRLRGLNTKETKLMRHIIYVHKASKLSETLAKLSPRGNGRHLVGPVSKPIALTTFGELKFGPKVRAGAAGRTWELFGNFGQTCSSRTLWI